ncbi:MAG: hypothetical protein OXI15_04480 [Chromatiales bacterium]|nr:hypothetical protein [Chromatiales bacterium]
MEPRFGRIDARLDRVDARLDRVDTRLDKQDDTLRMIWTQCGGKSDQRLPVDD